MVFVISNRIFHGFSDIPDTPGYPAALVFGDKKDFGPRLGFAWSVPGVRDLVVRSGYGIYYAPEVSNIFTNLTANPPIVARYSFTGTPTNPIAVQTAFSATILGAYTWSKTLTNADTSGNLGSGSYNGNNQDYLNRHDGRSYACFDIPQRLSAALIYDVPLFRNSPSRALKALLGGWQLGTIVTEQTGFAATIAGGTDTTGTGVNSRVNTVYGQKPMLPRGDRTRARWFNTAAFTPPVTGSFGTASRNPLHLPGLNQSEREDPRMSPLPYHAAATSGRPRRRCRGSGAGRSCSRVCAGLRRAGPCRTFARRRGACGSSRSTRRRFRRRGSSSGIRWAPRYPYPS
jgi:hypothetical protein